MSRLISSMIGEGWVIRKHSKSDSRAYKVQPSEKAQRMKDEIIATLHAGGREFMKGFPVAKQQALRKLVTQYTHVLEQRDER